VFNRFCYSSFQRLHHNELPCLVLRNILDHCSKNLPKPQLHDHPLSLSATTYWIYSRSPSVSGGRPLHSQPEDALFHSECVAQNAVQLYVYTLVYLTCVLPKWMWFKIRAQSDTYWKWVLLTSCIILWRSYNLENLFKKIFFRLWYCDSPNLLQYFGGFCPHGHFLRGDFTDLLASYDLFLLFGKKILPSLTFSLSDCLWKYIRNPELKNVTAFTCGGQNSISGKSFVFMSRYVIGSCWLHNDFGQLKSANWRRIFVWGDETTPLQDTGLRYFILSPRERRTKSAHECAL
jgi:hypothetical protein